MDKKIYEEYAVLDAQIKLLTGQKDKLKVKIVENLVATEEKAIDLAVGKFTIASLKTWKYTDKVSTLEEAFKAQKATEQSVGTATYTENPSLRFTTIKF